MSAAATSVSEATRASLLRQIEYYFSDMSFPYDDFLRGQCDEAQSIPALVLAGSPRMVSMTSELTPEQRTALILELVEQSEDVRIVNSDRLARIWPLPAEDAKADHSVYLSGVPKEYDEAALRSMLDGCRPSFGKVISVRRLRDVQRDRAYSGQVFIECEDAEKAAILVRAASKGSSGITCNKARVLRDFFDKQDATIREQKEKREAKKAAKADGSAPASGSGKRAREEEEAAAPAAPETAEEAAAREEKEAAEQALLLCFENAGPSTERETLEKICEPHGKVAPPLYCPFCHLLVCAPRGPCTYNPPSGSIRTLLRCTRCAQVAFVDCIRGDTAGTIRFEKAEGAAATLEAVSASPPDVGGAIASWRTLTREESLAYWQKYHDRKAAQHANKRQRGGGGKGGKGGKGGIAKKPRPGKDRRNRS